MKSDFKMYACAHFLFFKAKEESLEELSNCLSQSSVVKLSIRFRFGQQLATVAF